MEDKSLKGKSTVVDVIEKAKDISYFKGRVTLHSTTSWHTHHLGGGYTDTDKKTETISNKAKIRLKKGPWISS